MKNYRQILAVLMSCVLIWAMTMPSFAIIAPEDSVSGKRVAYFGEKNGEIIPISRMEYLSEHESLRPMYDRTYRYEEDYGRLFVDYDLEEKVSHDFTAGPNGGTMELEISVTYEASYEQSISTEAKTKLLGFLNDMEIGIAYNQSLAFSAATGVGNTYSQIVTPNETWVLYFSPRMYETHGTLTITTSYNNGWFSDELDIDATFPVLLSSGYADGHVYHKVVE